MKDPVKVLVVAINGYGHFYLKTLLEEVKCDDAVIAGVVDPEAVRSKYYRALKEFSIPVCTSPGDFYLGGGKADLAVIASPPHFHVPQSIMALHNGTNVLCEKPVSGQLSEVELLIKKTRESGKFAIAGYQWSYSEGIRGLKKDMLGGRFGRPLRMKSLCLWPRDFAYFSRNNWAYKKRDGKGNIIMDNIFNNAMAHFIHNILFLLGDTMDTSAEVSGIKAQVAAAYNIETYDTGAIFATTAGGAEILFIGSHAAEKSTDPCFRIEFEKGFVELKPGAEFITAKTTDRKEWNYPSPDSGHQFSKLFNAIGNVNGAGQPVCSIEAALPHARLVDMVNRNFDKGLKYSEGKIIRTKERLFVTGLDNMLLDCYRSFRMPEDILMQ
jgi:predicted dehydrogenase